MREVDEQAVAERVAGARRYLHYVWARQRPARRHGEYGRHHEVHGDDVNDALGDAGELLEQATGVTYDDRVGHPKAPDPSRVRLGEGGLDYGRPHDRQWQPTAPLEERPLAQRLRVGVDIGPTQGLGACFAQLDQAVLGPLGPKLLGALGQQGDPGGAQLERVPPPAGGRAALARGWTLRRPNEHAVPLPPRRAMRPGWQRASRTGELRVRGLASSRPRRRSRQPQGGGSPLDWF